MVDQLVRAADPPTMAVEIFGEPIRLAYGDRSDDRIDTICVVMMAPKVYHLRVAQGIPGQPAERRPVPDGHTVLAHVRVRAGAVMVAAHDIEPALAVASES